MERNSKIYVAGHTGMVGSAIVRGLKEQGYTNIITKTHKELDLTRQTDVEDFFEYEKPEFVFMAAAKVGGIRDNSEHPVEFGLINAKIACNIIENCYKQKVSKLLYLGSACVYPKNCGMPIKEEYVLTGPFETTNEAYAIAKNLGIRLCDYYNKEYHTNYIAAMPANCYGENDCFDPLNSHVIPAFIMKYHNAKKNHESEIVVWGTGTPLREFIYVNDLADACIFLMNQYNKAGVVNIGTSSEISIYELAECISRIVGFKGRITCDASKPDGMKRRILDCSKLSGLGWKPKISLEDGIQRLYNWYLLNIDSQEDNSAKI